MEKALTDTKPKGVIEAYMAIVEAAKARQQATTEGRQILASARAQYAEQQILARATHREGVREFMRAVDAALALDGITQSELKDYTGVTSQNLTRLRRQIKDWDREEGRNKEDES